MPIDAPPAPSQSHFKEHSFQTTLYESRQPAIEWNATKLTETLFALSDIPVQTNDVYSKCRRMLDTEYHKELQLRNTDLESPIEQINEVSNGVFRELAKIGFIKPAVELTKSNTLKVSLLLKEEPRLMLVVTQPFEALEDLTSGHVIFSIFEEKERLISDALPLQFLVQKIAAYMEETQAEV